MALSDDHRQLAAVVRSMLAERYAGEARAAMDASDVGLPAFWKDAADLGWLGLHVPERNGGQGYGLEELAVVMEEMGRQCAPGPFLPTVTVSALLTIAGTDEQRERLLPGLADGTTIAAVGLWGALSWSGDSARGSAIDGDAGPVLGAGTADLLLLGAGDDVVIVEAGPAGISSEDRQNIDLTRRCAAMTCAGVAVGSDNVLRGARRRALSLFRMLASAEAAGGAAACVDMASSYAKERRAFGRPIGQFQAIKVHCANMLVASEMAAAAAWDAARAAGSDEDDLASAVAAAVALDAYIMCAKVDIQVHGGIGYTWEHDAHLHLRRAAALASLAGTVSDARGDVARLMAGGTTRKLAVDLPPEAEAMRDEVRRFAAQYDALGPSERHRALLDAGYLFPHWPKPWGRGAGAVEQIVIDEELAGIDRTAGLPITAWTLPIVMPTIMTHGTEEQKERWIRPSLEGDLKWCQLFSEPDAGSDLVSLQTTAVRTDGGWLVSGSKVWTSTGHYADLGFALVRTDPDAPKHHGITCMAIDMHAPGMDVRPLREITGGETFNQEFMDDVFVPDENVIGEVNRGWAVARTTLGNERVSLGVGRGEEILTLADAAALEDRSVASEMGALLAEAHTLRVINLRQATLAITGGEPGAEGNVTKLVNAEHSQRVADLALRLSGASGVYSEAAQRMLGTRMLTIAGGTSEIVRNTIAERILGLPRDPRPGE
jgi:alkylation response protein AidB-like acyl-CoA dehydrogenase